MGREQSYRDLIAWQKGMSLVTEVYAVSAAWPESERFGLTNQARRAAVSVPANVAEGAGRSGARELRHHLSMAHGSLCELETHLLIAGNLQFSSDETIKNLIAQSEEVGRIIRGFLRRLDPAAR
jgi:four helix bundle protein